MTKCGIFAEDGEDTTRYLRREGRKEMMLVDATKEELRPQARRVWQRLDKNKFCLETP